MNENLAVAQSFRDQFVPQIAYTYTSMMGMANISFTKEELLKFNDQLNKIRKPKK